MGILDIFRHTEAKSRPKASAGQMFSGLDDPAFLEFVRSGGRAASDSLENMAVLRCVSLICESIGMLPLNLIESGPDKQHAIDHPAYRLLKYKPNGWQTPYEFKSQIQLAALQHGDGYARVVRSGNRPVALVPLPSESVEPKLTDDWRMEYGFTRKDGGKILMQSRDVLHLRDLSADGVCGISRTKLARKAIQLALDAESAASQVFKTGNLAGGAIESPNALSDQAYGRMKSSLDSDYSGSESAQRWMLLEEGSTANKFGSTASDAQHVENRDKQIEEIARGFGVPRPLLMMDDTSWGSGIEQLGIFFTQYGLQHWFTAWEQALGRVLLSDNELDRRHFKFNERALMRGTLKDQAEFFAKSLGAGGQAPWMKQNEIRDLSELPMVDDPAADLLRNPMTEKRTANEPAED